MTGTVTETSSVPSGATWRRRIPWIVIAVIAAVSLVIGSQHPAAPRTDAQRIASIEAIVKCPSCDNLSVGQSSAESAFDLREQISAEVHSGQSNSEIINEVVARYGTGILLRPPTSGLISAVWIIPIAVGFVGLVALGVFFWRRRRTSGVEVDETDRDLVAGALRRADTDEKAFDGL